MESIFFSLEILLFQGRLDRDSGVQRVVYNWVRPHFYHGQTPAQSLGSTEEAMTFENFAKVQII